MKNLEGFELSEFQVDEIRTIVGSNEEVIRIFAGIEFGTRLWPAT